MITLFHTFPRRWNDGGSWTYVNEYADNLADLMGDLRDAFNAPALPFVIAASGMSGRKPTGSKPNRRQELCEAQRNVTLRAPFIGSSLYVETRDFKRPSEVSPNPNERYHWSWNAESLFLIGDAMGKAALRLAYSTPPAMPPAMPPPVSDLAIAAVYLAQTHVLAPNATNFKLVGGARQPLYTFTSATHHAPLSHMFPRRAACTAQSAADGQRLLARDECDRDGKERRGDDAHAGWARHSAQRLERRARQGGTQARR